MNAPFRLLHWERGGELLLELSGLRVQLAEKQLQVLALRMRAAETKEQRAKIRAQRRGCQKSLDKAKQLHYLADKQVGSMRRVRRDIAAMCLGDLVTAKEAKAGWQAIRRVYAVAKPLGVMDVEMTRESRNEELYEPKGPAPRHPIPTTASGVSCLLGWSARYNCVPKQGSVAWQRLAELVENIDRAFEKGNRELGDKISHVCDNIALLDRQISREESREIAREQ